MIHEEQNISVSPEEMVVGTVWLLKGHEARFLVPCAPCASGILHRLGSCGPDHRQAGRTGT